MTDITLHSSMDTAVTVVSDVFIDKYMPTANGSYVKVYLYLLRCMSDSTPNFSISYLADHLDNTENDIVRALKYWEKVHLVRLDKDASGEIVGIFLLQPSSGGIPSESPDFNPSGVTSSVDPASRIGIQESAESTLPTVDSSTKGAMASSTNEAVLASSSISSINTTARPLYTQSEIEELTARDDLGWMTDVLEVYLQRPLKPKETQLIMYLYDSLQFSTDLILYLYEYCIDLGKKNTSYIETVALDWSTNKITTRDAAGEYVKTKNAVYSAVCKSFGLNNRQLGTAEQAYVNKWISTYKFDLPIIKEACNRTILRGKGPNFKYTDGTLSNWHKQNVHTLSDIAADDAKHAATKKTTKQPIPAVKTRFNSFQQRNYTDEEYAEIERRMMRN
ncbi:MAG: DnaD domain protein [Lachnospiraceae bacterium]|nr:DnaD domain protein [Lachnospiraceae bacterium]